VTNTMIQHVSILYTQILFKQTLKDDREVAEVKEEVVCEPIVSLNQAV